MSELPILLVGGGEGPRAATASHLKRRRHASQVVASDFPSTLPRSLQEPLDAILLLLPADDATGAEIMGIIMAQKTAPPVIIVGSDETVPNAQSAYRLGAQDYVRTHDDADRLYEALGLTLGTSRRDSELRYFRDRAAQASDWNAMVGSGEAMRSALRDVQQIMGRTSIRATPPILINGETGTGKGLVARCIHFNSVRRHAPYVDVNCAAIPAALIEAELLGHERGAFTDARTARAGLFETADGGSLFLDEIAALRIDLQAKLLTVTEEKRVRRIGGRDAKKVDVQIIAATHRDLGEMVHRGEFREDLFHRLNVIRVNLPPLRDRGEDKVRLAECFVEQMCNEYGLPLRDITPEAQDLIRDYDWPGNVRELKNQIEQIILVADDYEIRPDHFKLNRATRSVDVFDGNGDVRVRLPSEGVSLEAVERSILLEALKLCDGNVSRTARFLAISRQTLIYRLKKHEISGDGTQSSA